MAKNLAEHISVKSTPQTESAPNKPMVPNSGGGFSFVVDDFKRLERFCVLGSSEGTYYVKERELTKDNAKVVERCLDADPSRTVATVTQVSVEGRAPKNDPAILALAIAASHKSEAVKKLAYAAIPSVCRTGTHILHFAAAVNQLRGWGSGLRKAVANWYTGKSGPDLAYQLTKYQQRDGWSHKDVLRLCHAQADNPVQHTVLRWSVTGELTGERTITRGKGDKAKTVTYSPTDATAAPASILALENLKRASSESECVRLIELYADKAPRELVPTQYLTSAKVWGALLTHMPMTAMLRNLGNMTKCGLLAPLSDAAKTVAERLRDAERLKKSRIHPLSVLVAMKTYAQGRGMKGSGEWTAVQSVVDALQDAFYLAFDAVEPTGKRWAFGLDVSGSMTSAIAGMPISSCEAATALSLVSTRVEPHTFTGLFADRFEAAPFSRNTRLDDAMKYTAHRNFGATDCALLMRECLRQHIPVDVFAVITDSETYYGTPHPFQALKAYRAAMGIPSKLVVIATTSTGFSIADPSDAGMLDVCGFSTDVPAVIADFARN